MSEWKHGLCGCFDNCGICIISYILPCYTAGKNAEAVGDSCVMYGLLQLVPIANFVTVGLTRQKVRDQKGIEGGLGGDILCAWCCYFCIIVQTAQEVKDVIPANQNIVRA